MHAFTLLVASATTFALTSANPLTSLSARVPVSLNGVCGALNGTATCQGSGFGNCCSQFGWCGTDAAHCVTGCQAGYGTCGLPAASSTWNNLGCYTDTTLARTLSVSYNVAGNTVEKCQDTCAAAGYKYAGVEYGTQCYCDNAIMNNAVPAAAAGCNMPCPGNGAELCGGSNVMNLYSVIPTFQNLGCYTDTTNSRTLRTSLNLGGNTNQKCQNACYNAGFKYSGTEFGSQCFCDSSIQASGALVTDGSCNKACAGDDSQICGGPNRLTVSVFVAPVNPVVVLPL
ncbi:hypothetical protein V500_00331 [Pseudogymnoascus sp. VKM F-4518 (FW-2643)]|nr:hypothetical protein V500_00331 [Pseudogymnoascus sp. VKM F-4518 (FW-2643)]OBT44394.1 hypothetical protein VE00_07058 [Pseudogymnoascus sp. WSF 3629]